MLCAVPLRGALLASFSLVATLVQTITTDDMRGRVMSVYNVAFRGGMPVGNLVLGSLVPRFGVSTTIACAGGLLVCVALYFTVMHRRVANLSIRGVPHRQSCRCLPRRRDESRRCTLEACATAGIRFPETPGVRACDPACTA